MDIILSDDELAKYETEIEMLTAILDVNVSDRTARKMAVKLAERLREHGINLSGLNLAFYCGVNINIFLRFGKYAGVPLKNVPLRLRSASECAHATEVDGKNIRPRGEDGCFLDSSE